DLCRGRIGRYTRLLRATRTVRRLERHRHVRRVPPLLLRRLARGLGRRPAGLPGVRARDAIRRPAGDQGSADRLGSRHPGRVRHGARPGGAEPAQGRRARRVDRARRCPHDPPGGGPLAGAPPRTRPSSRRGRRLRRVVRGLRGPARAVLADGHQISGGLAPAAHTSAHARDARHAGRGRRRSPLLVAARRVVRPLARARRLRNQRVGGYPSLVPVRPVEGAPRRAEGSRIPPDGPLHLDRVRHRPNLRSGGRAHPCQERADQDDRRRGVQRDHRGDPRAARPAAARVRLQLRAESLLAHRYQPGIHTGASAAHHAGLRLVLCQAAEDLRDAPGVRVLGGGQGPALSLRRPARAVLGARQVNWKFFVVERLHDAYGLVNRLGVLDNPVMSDLFVRTYFAYKRLGDPFATLTRRRPDLFRGGHILDVGANIGYTAAVFARAVSSGFKVFAFEPDRRNCERLARTLRRLGYADRSEAVHAAVGAADGTIGIWQNYRHHAGHRVSTDIFRAERGVSATDQVPLVSLDRFVRDRGLAGAVRFIHVDR